MSKKYDVIYADPPWAGGRGGRVFKGANDHYSVMSIEELEKLDIDSITSDDAILFIWTIGLFLLPNKNNKFKSVIDVIQSWGFDYTTIGFTWLKTNKDGTLFKGIGNYTKSNGEICIIARKGKYLQRDDKTVFQALLEPRTKHSQKPSCVRDRIQKMYGKNKNYLEMFARESTNNWDVFGDEVVNSIQIPIK